MWGLGRDWVLDTEAVCSGELQELAVQSLCLLEEWVSLPCLSAYEEMGTEEPALNTSLVVSELLWRRTKCSLCAVLQNSSSWRTSAYLCSGCSCRGCGGGDV